MTDWSRVSFNGILQMSAGGNTVGLNYKVKWEVINSDYGGPVIEDFERSVSDRWGSISFSGFAVGLLPFPANTIRLTCEGSSEVKEFVIDFNSLVSKAFLEDFEFNLVES